MTHALNERIKDIPLPLRMRGLPISDRGFPVPWFVAWLKGEPDFRCIDTPKLVLAVKKNLCWVCGQQKGRYHAFVIGPMCAVNRTTSEPPSHIECATYSVQACPFLTQPRMRRNEHLLPEERLDPRGIHLERNPGAACIWVTREFKPFDAGNGVLFQIGDPVNVLWFCEGRTATREEIEHSIDTGLPHLRAMAEKEGTPAIAELDRCIERAQPFLPV